MSRMLSRKRPCGLWRQPGRRDTDGRARRAMPAWVMCCSWIQITTSFKLRNPTRPIETVRDILLRNKGGIPMNKDIFQGKWAQFKGELKQKWGQFTDDDLMQIEGDYEKFLGKVQERYGDQKDAVLKWAET